MGGGGFAADAVNSMRANRLLRKKRKFKDVKNLAIEESGKTEIEFKEISPEDLFRIKMEIRRKAKQAAKIEIIIYGSLTIILVGFFAYFAFLLIST